MLVVGSVASGAAGVCQVEVTSDGTSEWPSILTVDAYHRGQFSGRVSGGRRLDLHVISCSEDAWSDVARE